MRTKNDRSAGDRQTRPQPLPPSQLEIVINLNVSKEFGRGVQLLKGYFWSASFWSPNLAEPTSKLGLCLEVPNPPRHGQRRGHGIRKSSHVEFSRTPRRNLEDGNNADREAEQPTTKSVLIIAGSHFILPKYFHKKIFTFVHRNDECLCQRSRQSLPPQGTKRCQELVPHTALHQCK